MQGMKRFFHYFMCAARKGRIAHKIFVDILQGIRDIIIPEEDCPSPPDVAQAHERYWQDAVTLSSVALPSSVTTYVRGWCQEVSSGASSKCKNTLEDAEAGMSKHSNKPVSPAQSHWERVCLL